MAQKTRTAIRPGQDDVTAQLLDRLRSQFPELSDDEVVVAAAGVSALPGLEPLGVPDPVDGPAPRHRA